jgi:peroxiredoxin
MALENNTEAPDFELPNQFGQSIRLSDFRGKKPVALVFYPAAFTGTCTTELCELRDNLALFQSSGIELMGISVDTKAALRVFAEQEGYDFTLLSDFWPHGAVAKDYGVFNEEKGTATRGTFLIDLDGIIRASIVAAPGQARAFEEYETAVRELVPVG